MKKILIDGSYENETRIALVLNNSVQEYKYSDNRQQNILNNIYLAKVIKIEPSLQAAFVMYEGDKTGFLSFSEIHPAYYNARKNSDLAKILRKINIPSFDFVENDYAFKDSDQVHHVSEADDCYSKDNITVINEYKNDDSEIEPISLNASSKKQTPDSVRKNIQDVISINQYLLVQVSKEERGGKSASFTTYISLVGRYMIMHPNTAKNTGISRRISDFEEKKRLKSIVNELLNKDNTNEYASIIVRTGCLNKKDYEIKNDYAYLARIWNEIVEFVIKNFTHGLVHAEDDPLLRALKDLLDHRVQSVYVSGEKIYYKVIEFTNRALPEESNKINLYDEKQPIFSYFGIESQISGLFQPVVDLPSGGYLIINPTEALTAIDVNSGKSTNEKNVENTALATNLEAAQEIAKQIKLREISGIIVIDFIDMKEKKNNKLVETNFKQALYKDNARMQIGTISDFGLLEMSRQRIKSSFLETYCRQCLTCKGKGVLRSSAYNSSMILRTLEDEISKNGYISVNIYAHQNAITDILNNRRAILSQIESKHSTKINFIIENNENEEVFGIEGSSFNSSISKKNKVNVNKEIPPVQDLDVAIIKKTEEAINKTKPSSIYRKKSRYKIVKKNARIISKESL
jgi:ribonuclease E